MVMEKEYGRAQMRQFLKIELDRYLGRHGGELIDELPWMEVGVFARGKSGEERDEKVLYLQRRRVTAENPIVTVVVDGLPYEAGFDPYNKLIDRVSSDNRKKVSLQ